MLNTNRYTKEIKFQDNSYSRERELKLTPSLIWDVMQEFKACEIVKYLDLTKASRVLDIGCGSGGMAISILQNLHKNNGLQIVGFDISKVGVTKAADRALYYKANGSTNWLIANAEDFPFKEDSFDAIYCHATLHHITDKEKCVKEIVRVAKHGARFYFAEPKWSILRAIASLVLKKYIISKGLTTTTEEAMSERELKQLFNNHVISFVSGSFWLAILTTFLHPRNPRLNFFLVRLDRAVARVPFLRWLSWGEICAVGCINKIRI